MLGPLFCRKGSGSLYLRVRAATNESFIFELSLNEMRSQSSWLEYFSVVVPAPLYTHRIWYYSPAPHTNGVQIKELRCHSILRLRKLIGIDDLDHTCERDCRIWISKDPGSQYLDTLTFSMTL